MKKNSLVDAVIILISISVCFFMISIPFILQSEIKKMNYELRKVNENTVLVIHGLGLYPAGFDEDEEINEKKKE